MVDIAEWFSGRLPADFYHLMVGEKLGYGISRSVYAVNQNPGWVFKFETATRTFQNIMEWEIWQAIKDHPETAKWLAPCHFISDNGMVLIQSRTRKIEFYEMPTEVPAFVTDMQEKNWGLIDGKPVLHDYGYTHLLWNARKARLKKHDEHEAIQREFMQKFQKATD